MFRRISFLAVLVPSVILFGCTSNTAPAVAPPANQKPASSGTEVTLTQVDSTGLDEVIAKHQGKVVLVDYWATWCGPCKKAFPKTVALARKFADKPFVALTLSVDTADAHNAAKEFLSQQPAPMEHYVGKFSDQDDPLEIFELKGLPTIRLYDKTGKLAGTWDDGGDHEADIEAKIQELLGE